MIIPLIIKYSVYISLEGIEVLGKIMRDSVISIADTLIISNGAIT